MIGGYGIPSSAAGIRASGSSVRRLHRGGLGGLRSPAHRRPSSQVRSALRRLPSAGRGVRSFTFRSLVRLAAARGCFVTTMDAPANAPIFSISSRSLIHMADARRTGPIERNCFQRGCSSRLNSSIPAISPRRASRPKNARLPSCGPTGNSPSKLFGNAPSMPPPVTAAEPTARRARCPRCCARCCPRIGGDLQLADSAHRLSDYGVVIIVDQRQESTRPLAGGELCESLAEYLTPPLSEHGPRVRQRRGGLRDPACRSQQMRATASRLYGSTKLGRTYLSQVEVRGGVPDQETARVRNVGTGLSRGRTRLARGRTCLTCPSSEGGLGWRANDAPARQACG